MQILQVLELVLHFLWMKMKRRFSRFSSNQWWARRTYSIWTRSRPTSQVQSATSLQSRLINSPIKAIAFGRTTITHLQEWYPSIHGWLAMLVCILGTLFNVANILVLTHKDMRNPVNMILTGIAVADCLIMIEYIPFIIHMWRLHDTEIPKEERW